jgi:hypothetical protein
MKHVAVLELSDKEKSEILVALSIILSSKADDVSVYFKTVRLAEAAA